jgi:hypothetical protein
MADGYPLNPGSSVAMDRGYNDYPLFSQWTARNLFRHARNIRSEPPIRFSGEKAQKDGRCLLRRVGDRVVFQGAQTGSQRQELRRYQRERFAHSDLDTLGLA